MIATMSAARPAFAEPAASRYRSAVGVDQPLVNRANKAALRARRPDGRALIVLTVDTPDVMSLPVVAGLGWLS